LGGCLDFSRLEAESLCPASTAPLCDGFEDQALSPVWTQTKSGGGSLALDFSRAIRGRSSLHLHLNPIPAGQTARAEIAEERSEMHPSTTYWIRAFLYASSTPAGLTSVLKIQSAEPTYTGVTVAFQNGFLSVENDIQGATATAVDRFPTERWVCLELHVEEATNGVMELSLDDVKIPELTLSGDTQPQSPFGSIYFGLWLTKAAATNEPAADLWLDEVMVDRAPIGCAK
jgi:hypothetical protein